MRERSEIFLFAAFCCLILRSRSDSPLKGIFSYNRIIVTFQEGLRTMQEMKETNLTNARTAGGHEAATPLLWLYSRKDRSGKRGISDVEFAAGERLRAELTFAGLSPRVTMDWQGLGVIDGSASFGLNPTEATIAARQRVRQALLAVGSECAGVLTDLCGFLKGLEQIEQERNWPRRSAKIVVQMALAALARHYGLQAEARGPASGRSRTWRAEGARPTQFPDQNAAKG
jgi:hypothetical protein